VHLDEGLVGLLEGAGGLLGELGQGQRIECLAAEVEFDVGAGEERETGLGEGAGDVVAKDFLELVLGVVVELSQGGVPFSQSF
jgi:hypothetical protein